MNPFRTLRLALVALAFALPAQAQGPAADLGTTLPMTDRAMRAAAGGSTTLADVAGAKGTAVMFWCNSCPWVKKYEDRVISLAAEYEKAGIGFIAVNANDPVAFPADNLEAMAARVAEKKYPFPYVLDDGSRLARALGATRTPQVFLFDAQNRLVYEGTVDDSPSDATQVESAYLRNALSHLVAGEDIAVQRTKAFGCTIKFQEG